MVDLENMTGTVVPDDEDILEVGPGIWYALQGTSKGIREQEGENKLDCCEKDVIRAEGCRKVTKEGYSRSSMGAPTRPETYWKAAARNERSARAPVVKL